MLQRPRRVEGVVQELVASTHHDRPGHVVHLVDNNTSNSNTCCRLHDTRSDAGVRARPRVPVLVCAGPAQNNRERRESAHLAMPRHPYIYIYICVYTYVYYYDYYYYYYYYNYYS